MVKSVNCCNSCCKTNDSEQNFRNKQSFISPIFGCFNGKEEFHVDRNGRRVSTIRNRLHFSVNATNNDCLNNISDNLKEARTNHISFVTKILIKDILKNCTDLQPGHDMYTDKDLIKYFDSIMNNNIIKGYDKVMEDQIKHNSDNDHILKDRLYSMLSRKEAVKYDRYDLEEIAKCFINESTENPKKMRFTHYFIRYLGIKGYLKVGQYENIRKIFKNEIKVVINQQIKNYKSQEAITSASHTNNTTQIEKLPKIGKDYILLKSYEQLLVHNAHRTNTCSRCCKSSFSSDSLIIEARKTCKQLNQSYINILTNFTAQTNDIIDPNPEQFVRLEKTIMSVFELINEDVAYIEIQHDIDSRLNFLIENFFRFIKTNRFLLNHVSVASIFLDIIDLNNSLIENKKIEFNIQQKLEEILDPEFLKKIIDSKKEASYDGMNNMIESRMFVEETLDATARLLPKMMFEFQQQAQSRYLYGINNEASSVASIREVPSNFMLQYPNDTITTNLSRTQSSNPRSYEALRLPAIENQISKITLQDHTQNNREVPAAGTSSIIRSPIIEGSYELQNSPVLKKQEKKEEEKMIKSGVIKDPKVLNSQNNVINEIHNCLKSNKISLKHVEDFKFS